MDRLSPLVAVAISGLALGGCENRNGGETGTSGGATRERVNAVKAKESDRQTPEELCDVFPKPGQEPAFAPPAFASGSLADPGKGWRWINMWATWCKPCIEEMPRLASWQSKLTARGLDVALVFINADESDEVVAAFRKQHPGTPDGPRLADASALGTWLEQLGVGGATLPVHVFVDTQQRVRCVRASAVDDADYDAIATLLGAR